MVIQKINQLTVNNVQSSGQMSVNQFMINTSILNEKDLDKLQNNIIISTIKLRVMARHMILIWLI